MVGAEREKNLILEPLVSVFHLLLNNTNCDIWYHYFYRSKLLLITP